MIKLENVDGNIRLSLEVVGYEFPDSPKDDWCLLQVGIDQEGQTCELIDPALETTELVHLLRWFSSLSEGRLPRYAHLTFTEPCISFEFLAFKDNVIRIAVRLSRELKPDFKIRQFGRSSDNWSIVFELDQVQFKSIRDGLSDTLDRFPIRGS